LRNNIVSSLAAKGKNGLSYDASKTNYAILIAICFGHLANDLLQAIIPAALPMLKDNYSLTFAQVGIITLVFQLSSSIFQPIVGQYTDKHPKPYSQVIGMVFSGVGVVLLSFSNHYYLVLFSISLIGIGSSIFHPESSRVAFLSSGGKRSLAQSVFQIGGNFGTALGPLLFAWIVIPHGQRNIIWFVGVAFFAQIFLAYIAKWYTGVLKAVDQHKKNIVLVPDISALRVNFAVGVLLLLIFSKFFYISSIVSYFQFYTMEKFQVTDTQAQIYLFYFLISVALGTLFGGFLGDKLGRKYIIWISVLGAAPFTLLLPYVHLTMTGILIAVIGFIMSSAFPSIIVYAQELLPKRLGMVSGLFYGFAFGMGGLGAAILGWWADQTSITNVYTICSYLPLIGIVAYFLPNLKKIKFREEAIS